MGCLSSPQVGKGCMAPGSALAPSPGFLPSVSNFNLGLLTLHTHSHIPTGSHAHMIHVTLTSHLLSNSTAVHTHTCTPASVCTLSCPGLCAHCACSTVRACPRKHARRRGCWPWPWATFLCCHLRASWRRPGRTLCWRRFSTTWCSANWTRWALKP